MPDTGNDISTLNSLAASVIDSVDGYNESSQGASERFASLFTSRATERREVLRQLQAEVSRLGGNPEDDGTLLAGAHRAFIDLKSAVTGRDDKAIIDEVERGEDHLKGKFDDALKDATLSPTVRTVVEAAYASVRAGHDQIRDLKQSMQA